MNYVDANILIYALSDATEKGHKSRKLLQEERLATSVLSLDEVAFQLRKYSLQESLEGVQKISASPMMLLISFLPEDVGAFKEMLALGLKPRDAIHALTAKKVRASIIYSEDADFDKLPITRKIPW